MKSYEPATEAGEIPLHEFPAMSYVHAARRAAESAQAERERDRLARWQSLTERERKAVRAAVLSEKPDLERYPRIVETLCLVKI